MSNKKPKLLPMEASGGGGVNAVMVAADLISSLPDALLHHIMSFLRAWEVVRTCVLSRRWSHLCASAPCIDLRVWRLGRHHPPPYPLARFVCHFLLEREVSAPVDTLWLLSSPVYDRGLKEEDDEEEEYDYSKSDVEIWICAAIMRRVRVILLARHPKDDTFFSFKRIDMITCHLKHLNLSLSMLGDRALRQLSSHCPCLEVLDLKRCCLYGQGLEISSTSLKSLVIVECKIRADLNISTPNLVSLRCVKPHHRAPLFENLGSIATGIIMLDDSILYVGYKDAYKDMNGTATYEGSDSGSDCSLRIEPEYGSDTDSDASTCEYSEIANDYEDKQYPDCGEDHINSNYYGICHGSGCRHNYGNYSYNCYDDNCRVDRSKVLGGHNILHCLANATSLELLADAGEIILNRELKACPCPTFINLKTLSLGEWSMAADFDPLVFFLQHTPNLERLFLELKLDRHCRKVMESVGRLEGIACTHLKIVKIKCCKQDARVNLLAELFRANGVSIEKIYVRHTHSSCCPPKPW